MEGRVGLKIRGKQYGRKEGKINKLKGHTVKERRKLIQKSKEINRMVKEDDYTKRLKP